MRGSLRTSRWQLGLWELWPPANPIWSNGAHHEDVIPSCHAPIPNPPCHPYKALLPVEFCLETEVLASIDDRFCNQYHLAISPASTNLTVTQASILAALTMFRTQIARQVRLFSTSPIVRKSPVETVKDAAKTVDRTVSDAAVKGIEKGGTFSLLLIPLHRDS